MIIVLPGYSLHNKEWAYDVKKNLRTDTEVVVYEWGHWPPAQTTGSENSMVRGKASGSVRKSMNVKSEVENILALVGKDKVSFVAKSVGTRVLVTLAPKIKNQIQKVIMCGIPIDPLKYSQGFKAIGSEKVLIFQNSKDPFMPALAIKAYLKIIDKNIKVIEKQASNHEYPYYDEFNEFLNDL